MRPGRKNDATMREDCMKPAPNDLPPYGFVSPGCHPLRRSSNVPYGTVLTAIC